MLNCDAFLNVINSNIKNLLIHLSDQRPHSRHWQNGLTKQHLTECQLTKCQVDETARRQLFNLKVKVFLMNEKSLFDTERSIK